MLEVKNAARTFENGKTAFKNLSFTAEKQEIIGIVGTSGCGKSTILRAISGLDPDFTGEINVGGGSAQSLNDDVGFIFQEPRLMPWLTVEENIGFGLKLKNTKDHAPAVQQFIEWVGLQGFENHYPKELSGGMAQRVAIARALVLSPNILLLDEPLSALDAFTKMQLQDLLLDVWRRAQSTFLLVTHDLEEALYLCDRILVLRGQPGELYADVKVEQPRPRTRSDQRLIKQKEEILNILDLNQHVG